MLTLQATVNHYWIQVTAKRDQTKREVTLVIPATDYIF